jgi:hypothetical protein
MRTIAGAVLILALAVCFAAGQICDALHSTAKVMGNSSAFTYLAAGVLVLFGLLLIAGGDRPRGRGPSGEEGKPA